MIFFFGVKFNRFSAMFFRLFCSYYYDNNKLTVGQFIRSSVVFLIVEFNSHHPFTISHHHSDPKEESSETN